MIMKAAPHTHFAPAKLNRQVSLRFIILALIIDFLKNSNYSLCTSTKNGNDVGKY